MGLAVVLVRTHSPGNLGSAARAARNFGASLLLLDPRADRGHPDALAFASGAGGLLAAAHVAADWEEIRANATRLVALTSLRGRAARGLPPSTTWPAVRREAASGDVVLVFGPERSGLTAEELSGCDARLALPADPAFPTLNLAQAVAASLALCASGRAPTAHREAATSLEVARFLDRFHALLAASGYPGKGRSAHVVSELDSFLRRARPTSREITLLLGALSALETRASPATGPSPRPRAARGRPPRP